MGAVEGVVRAAPLPFRKKIKICRCCGEQSCLPGSALCNPANGDAQNPNWPDLRALRSLLSFQPGLLSIKSHRKAIQFIEPCYPGTIPSSCGLSESDDSWYQQQLSESPLWVALGKARHAPKQRERRRKKKKKKKKKKREKKKTRGQSSQSLLERNTA